MTRMGMLGVGTVAVLVLTLIGVSSASAGLPEWGSCEALAGGRYADANCVVKAHPISTGSYERKAPCS
jgi:hypothetical protein